jgi:hypothetical protein
VVLTATSAVAQEPAPSPRDATRSDGFEYQARSETYVRWFQRALLPGPSGAVVRTDTVVPVHEYLFVRASNVDAPWAKDSIDVELSGWTSAAGGRLEYDPRADGDVTVASVRARYRSMYVRLGRQVVAGGAARFSRFDGLSAGALAPYGLGLDAYAGLTVLPRWSDRPGYFMLGSASDTLLRSTDWLPESNRGGYWVAGARAYYDKPGLVQGGLSFHEQREQGELGRRSAAVDIAVTPSELFAGSASALYDTDASSIADAHVVLELTPVKDVSLSGEYNHTDPSLFLSHQSVLSVFGTDLFDEFGGDASITALGRVTLGAASYIEVFGGDRRGTRTSWHVRGSPDKKRTLTGGFVYTRVTDTDNGYYSLRAFVSYRFVPRAAATYEQYLYLYDHAISDVDKSTVEAATVEYRVLPPLRVMLGGSVVSSPLARLDAQALLRVVYEPAGSMGGAP